MRACPRCGAAIQAGAAFCSACGQPLAYAPPQPPPVVYIPPIQQNVIVNVGSKPKSGSAGCGCLIVLVLVVWFCAGHPGCDDTAYNIPVIQSTQPAKPAPPKRSDSELDAQYERSESTRQREIDRLYDAAYQDSRAKGADVEDAMQQASEKVGTPSMHWPDGYFKRHPDYNPK